MTMAADALIRFIERCPTSFHTVAVLKAELMRLGYHPLSECSSWELESDTAYFIEKKGALIAFKTPKAALSSLVAILSHTDSPGLKIKCQPQKKQQEMEVIGIEIYGSPLIYTYIDQPLYPAGLVYTNHSGELKKHLVELKDMPCIIAPLAIHLDRDVNHKGATFNKQTDLNPIFSLSDSFSSVLAKKFDDPIVNYDLFLVPTQPAHTVGAHRELLAAYRIDNLSSVMASFQALEKSSSSAACLKMAIFFDHEEIGSRTEVGADSVMVDHLIQRIALALTADPSAHFKIRSNSIAFSVDVAHGVHPHRSATHDLESPPRLGMGPVVKFSAQKRYATSYELAAKLSIGHHGVSLQKFYPHGELGSGSTVGPFFASSTGIDTLDLGVAILGMHALKELMAVQDFVQLEKILSYAYQMLDG